MPNVCLTRVEVFSAAHRLHSPKLSDEENENIFGKCNNKNGHGHNYVWKVTLYGPVDENTGMVYNLADLKKEMAMVMDGIDHKHIDLDIEYFKTNISTTENVCVYLWNQLKQVMSRPDLLKEVVLEETPKNVFSYSGQ